VTNFDIALDLDGVTYDWSGVARLLLREFWDQEQLVGDPTEWHWNLAEGVPMPAWDWLWDPEGGIAHGLFAHGHVVKGAPEGVRALAAYGRLSLVTHRPRAAIADTLAWLVGQFGRFNPYPFSGIHILTNGEPKTQVPFDVLIDDKGDNALAVMDSTDRDAIIFDQPWNRAGAAVEAERAGAIRAYGWADVLFYVSQLQQQNVRGPADA
jgi:hypothetical protein